MKIFTVFTTILMLLFSNRYSYARETCDCKANFDWVKETFENNDAGFEYALLQKGKNEYEKHTALILEKVDKAVTKDECATIIGEWLSFFRKAHWSILPINNQANQNLQDQWETISISEENIREKVSDENPRSPEGVWRTGGYTIGVFEVQNEYKGIILSSDNEHWKPNQLKLKISKDSSGVFYMGNFSANNFDNYSFIGKNTLKLNNLYLERVYPRFEEEQGIALYAREMITATPFIHKLSEKTILLRIPSFDEFYKSDIDSLLASNHELITATENLIIDIRNNGGGSDNSYDKVVPLLYTNPIRITNLEFLSTPLNNKRMEEYLSIPNLSERSKQQVNDALQKLNANIGKFVNLGDSKTTDIQEMDTIMPLPKQVAIMINQLNGSTAEQFLLAAKQSKKVKLFGVTTMGVLDISNMYFVDSPSNEFTLGYCLSKSLRIPDMAIDNIGIQPDYFIDRSIPDENWLEFVLNILE